MKRIKYDQTSETCLTSIKYDQISETMAYLNRIKDNQTTEKMSCLTRIKDDQTSETMTCMTTIKDFQTSETISCLNRIKDDKTSESEDKQTNYTEDVHNFKVQTNVDVNGRYQTNIHKTVADKTEDNHIMNYEIVNIEIEVDSDETIKDNQSWDEQSCYVPMTNILLKRRWKSNKELNLPE